MPAQRLPTAMQIAKPVTGNEQWAFAGLRMSLAALRRMKWVGRRARVWKCRQAQLCRAPRACKGSGVGMCGGVSSVARVRAEILTDDLRPTVLRDAAEPAAAAAPSGCTVRKQLPGTQNGVRRRSPRAAACSCGVMCHCRSTPGSNWS